MATTLTPNLRLRVNSNLTADAKYNLLRIDALGSVFQLDNTDNAVVRSAENIIFRPNDTTVGGSGSGGRVQLGTQDQPLASLDIHADEVNTGSISFSDQGTGGTKKLFLQYDSTLNGAVDTGADRTLSLDLEGADRQLVLGGNLSLMGGSLALSLSSDVTWALPAADSAGILANDGSGNLSWSAAGSGTVTSVDMTAASPLALTGAPITTSGTLALGFQNQLANTVFAGPTSGGASAPVFRNLVAADINQVPGFRAMSAMWTSGTTLTITHNWGTRKVLVEILDGDNGYREVMADDETRPTDNTVVLTSNEAPANWLVLLKEVP